MLEKIYIRQFLKKKHFW